MLDGFEELALPEIVIRSRAWFAVCGLAMRRDLSGIGPGRANDSRESRVDRRARASRHSPPRACTRRSVSRRPRPRSLSAYQLRQWGVTGDPGANGTLRMRASILNTAAQVQPYPLLRVTLRQPLRLTARHP